MYDPSENDLRFAIQHTIGLDQISHLDAFADVSPDLVDAVLSEAAKIAREELAPCNNSGDIQGSKWNSDFTVQTPDGFKKAHDALSAGGWYGIEIAEEFGGQALPHLISAAVGEMFHSANMGFSLCHLLTQGLTHALTVSASQEQKEKFLPPMAEGRWTGTMNLTEPQAGTDLAAIKSTAVKEGDHYRIKGQKIFITYGEHDMAENIVHLVLARAEGAPEGVNGISVFIVPKFLVNDDGSLGERNDVKCVSIEHKLGINGSPTAVLQFGEDKGAIGYLVGEENQGLKIMFGMMNHARFGVGIQGLSISNRAFYQAKEYASERVQGRPLDRNEKDTIDHHPDVMRLLATMRAEIEGQRGMSLYGAAALDRAHYETGDDKAFWAERSSLMVPIIKGWLTERSLNLTSDAVQVHGGMGFIEETGAAQHYRDARILPIYEGTTAIQANDLMFRKTLRDGGKAVNSLLAEIKTDAETASKVDDANIANAAADVLRGTKTAQRAVEFILSNTLSQREAAAISVPYLMMMGTLTGGWMSVKSAIAAKDAMNSGTWDQTFLDAKISLAQVFAKHTLPEVEKYANIVFDGGASIEAMAPEIL
ncbi:acyl-CoA dehydrogenase [Amylibacter ulvae]|uniref:Acyl-CoA dehydrogenase n=1 Tax=Paramylibacter ulvae TaxID=1651968 RepID=A0ABQ3CZA2_9RHOB|nr:acyl-CoA dehydrogenase [Amylibacter ulvae]GHA48378.1 acyl-CoA dehydrogenase [Amylibacter ulvae]